jgi:hypothetical protein
VGDSYCSSTGCTISQQISWLYIQQFAIDPPRQKTALISFEDHMERALDAKAGVWYGQADESWHWGNTNEEGLARYNIVIKVESKTYDLYDEQLDWFIVYSR